MRDLNAAWSRVVKVHERGLWIFLKNYHLVRVRSLTRDAKFHQMKYED